jgi:hypothetical protein
MSRLLLGVVAACGLALASTGLASSASRLPGFHSPSGNITCLFVPSSRDDAGHRLPARLLCSIAKARYSARLQDRCINPNGAVGAGVDWHGWSLSPAGRGTILCSGGILYNPSTSRPSYMTLRYGKTMRQGVITCWSRVAGVTCRNRHGHGLSISRLSWRVW